MDFFHNPSPAFLVALPSGLFSVIRPTRFFLRRRQGLFLQSVPRVFLRRPQGILPFPVPRVQAGGNRRLQATARSPNRGAGVITSAAGFGAAQAPSAPERRPSQRSASFFLFRGQKNKPKTGTKIIRGPPAIRPERAYQTMETLMRFPENFKKLSGGSKI